MCIPTCLPHEYVTICPLQVLLQLGSSAISPVHAATSMPNGVVPHDIDPEGSPPSFTLSGFECTTTDGTYVKSGPMVNERSAYVKDGSTVKWCCYDAGHGNWKIQPPKCKGGSAAWACTTNGRVPWESGGNMWKEYVMINRKWVKRAPVVFVVLVPMPHTLYTLAHAAHPIAHSRYTHTAKSTPVPDHNNPYAHGP